MESLSDMDKDKQECKWLTPLILASWEAEIRSIWFQGNLGKVFQRSPPMGVKIWGDRKKRNEENEKEDA